MTPEEKKAFSDRILARMHRLAAEIPDPPDVVLDDEDDEDEPEELEQFPDVLL